MRYFVLPYIQGSKAVKRIKAGIGAKSIKLVNSKWRPKPTRIVVNWGSSQPPIDLGTKLLNKPGNVGVATNKLHALICMRDNGVNVPVFTNRLEVAREWFADRKAVVFCRTLLRSSGGKGIVIATSADALVNAPLYTKRVRKADEFRVHVFKGEVIDVAQKRLRNGLANAENRNSYVRNHDNGWIFAHNNVVCPDEVKQECVKAVTALGLDFGAVDVVICKDTGRPVILEVNTAPGLENTQTITAYINSFNNYKKKEEEKQYAYSTFYKAAAKPRNI